MCTEVIWASSINSPRTLANKIWGEQNLKFLFVSVKYFLYSLLLVICCREEMMMTGDWMMTGSWPRVPFPVANLMPELFHFLSWDCCEQFCVKRERDWPNFDLRVTSRWTNQSSLCGTWPWSANQNSPHDRCLCRSANQSCRCGEWPSFK